MQLPHPLRSLKTLSQLAAIAVIGTTTNTTLADDCSADSSWFPHSQTPRPNDAAFESVSNCVFHQWSWQMFLWLTQEENGQPRFLNFNTPQSLLGMEHRGMLPRNTKNPSSESFDEYLQAGTDGILVDHNGKAVYYSQYLNAVFENFMRDNDFTNPEAVLNMANTAPDTEFPIVDTRGALELKASWKIVGDDEDTSDMFTMKTEVAELENENGQIVVNPDKTDTVTVALVGFHIGGIVNGHPEMIWATFEHRDNAPNVAPGTTLEDVVSKDNYTFYTGGTILGECNINPAVAGLKLSERKQTLSPITQVCRQYEYGNPQGKDATANQNNNTQSIQTINASVLENFQRTDPNSVWANYSEVGAIWFLETDALEPGMTLATDSFKAPSGNDVSLTGSLKLSNSTIETFTQRQTTMDNCFRCHNTMQEFPPKMSLKPLPATNLNISHAFQNIFFWSQEMDQQQ